MNRRQEIRDDIKRTIRINKAGKWYIAEAEYNDISKVAQGDSKREAIDALLKEFYEFEQLEKELQQEEEQIRKDMNRRRNRSERRAEHILDYSKKFHNQNNS